MAYRDQKLAYRTLSELASAQGGYFTAKQADKAGYDYSHLTYHLKCSNFERVGRGLYRISTMPRSEYDDLIQLSLWSRGRDDKPQAVISHDSALSLHDLGDTLPGKIHLTVPQGFRKTPLSVCILHRGNLSRTETTSWGGFRVTTPLRTLLDVALDDAVSTEQLQIAVQAAVDRGIVILKQLRTLAQFDRDGRLWTAVERI